MFHFKLHAAEEIQLLLPENQPEVRTSGAIVLGLACLALAMPLVAMRLFAEAGAARRSAALLNAEVPRGG